MLRSHGATTVAVEGECVLVFRSVSWVGVYRKTIGSCPTHFVAMHAVERCCGFRDLSPNEPAFVRLSGKLSQSFNDVVCCWGGFNGCNIKSSTLGVGYAFSAAELILSRCVWPAVAGSMSALSPLLLRILADVESFVIDAHALKSFVLCFCGPCFWGTLSAVSSEPRLSGFWKLAVSLLVFNRRTVFCADHQQHMLMLLGHVSFLLKLRDKGCSADICRSSSIHQPQPPL